MGRIPVYVTPAEVHRMMAQLHGDERLLVELLWYTGGRVSEVLGLRAGDITDTGIILRNLKQRSLDYKHVLLPPPVLARLRELTASLSPDQLIFESPKRPGKPRSRVWAWSVVKKAATLAGVEKTRYSDRLPTPAWPHTLRHGYATALLMQRVPLTAVQRQLGHKKVEHTAVYTQIADPHLMDILAEVEL